MEHALPAVTLQFFQPESHVRAPTLIAIVKRAVRGATPDLLRYRIEQCPRLAFRLLAVLNIDGYSAPLDQVSLLVAQRCGANQEPAILSVSPALGDFILDRLSSGHVRWAIFQHY